MKKYLLDIEVFWEHFEVSILNHITDERLCFMVNKNRDDRNALRLWLKEPNFIITFNGIRYDIAVLTFCEQNNWFSNLDALSFCEKVKQFSDLLINSRKKVEEIADQLEEDNLFKGTGDRTHKKLQSAIKEDNLLVYSYIDKCFKQSIQIDLYAYWSTMLRLSKKISLKGLGIQMGYPVVQELPYDPDIRNITDEMIEQIHYYCSVHDLGILKMLTEHFEGKGHVPIGPLGTIQLRGLISKKYGFNAWSWDAPKIASQVLLKGYCDKTGKSRYDTNKLRFEKPDIYFRKLLELEPFVYQTPIIKQVYEEWLNAVNTFDREFVVDFPSGHAVKISVGIGGIHSINNCEIWKEDENYLIITDDISAMYPTNIENWKAFRFPEVLENYVHFKTLRQTETKPGIRNSVKNSKEWHEFKELDLFYKLILNGTSGLLDMKHGWLYNPEGIMKVRCGGQLILLWIVDQSVLNGIDVISANTDGLEVKCPREKYEIYQRIVKEAEQLFNVEFERDFYSKICYHSVNCYIAVNQKGEVKEKGKYFVRKPELGNAVNFAVIPHLLYDYFINNEKPEEAISKYTDILMFCASQKVDKSYDVYWNNQKQQRLNRYYVSKKGAYLFKYRNKTMSHLLKGYGVMLYNNHEVKPIEEYHIDYSFYITQCRKIINEIERYNQQTLF